MSITLDISTLYRDLEEKLGLEWISGIEYADHTVHTSKDHSHEISLAGQLNLINPHRIQVLGKKELAYLESLGKNSRKDALNQLFSGQSKLVG